MPLFAQARLFTPRPAIRGLGGPLGAPRRRHRVGAPPLVSLLTLFTVRTGRARELGPVARFRRPSVTLRRSRQQRQRQVQTAARPQQPSKRGRQRPPRAPRARRWHRGSQVRLPAGAACRLIIIKAACKTLGARLLRQLQLRSRRALPASRRLRPGPASCAAKVRLPAHGAQEAFKGRARLSLWICGCRSHDHGGAPHAARAGAAHRRHAGHGR